MIELLLFLSTYVAVFSLGLQSLNVNQGHYLAAAGTSVLISSGHILLYKYMPEAAAGQMAAYYAGGILGITSSMWVHARTLGKKRLQDQAAAEKRIADAVLAQLLVIQNARRTDIR
jgi:hypothetical protein